MKFKVIAVSFLLVFLPSFKGFAQYRYEPGKPVSDRLNGGSGYPGTIYLPPGGTPQTGTNASGGNKSNGWGTPNPNWNPNAPDMKAYEDAMRRGGSSSKSKTIVGADRSLLTTVKGRDLTFIGDDYQTPPLGLDLPDGSYVSFRLENDHSLSSEISVGGIYDANNKAFNVLRAAETLPFKYLVTPVTFDSDIYVNHDGRTLQYKDIHYHLAGEMEPQHWDQNFSGSSQVLMGIWKRRKGGAIGVGIPGVRYSFDLKVKSNVDCIQTSISPRGDSKETDKVLGEDSFSTQVRDEVAPFYIKVVKTCNESPTKELGTFDFIVDMTNVTISDATP